MLLADTHFTPVIGIDLHFTTLPPFNPFHPYLGIVLDPFDYIPFLGGTIHVNGIKRGVSDTSGIIITLFHIPLFTPPWAMTPIIGHESMNFFAAQNVYADGMRFSPKGHMLMTCNDIGIPLSLGLGKMKIGKKMLPFVPTLFAPTSFSLPIPMGAPVNVGGPFVPDWTGALMGLLASFGFSSMLKILRKGLTRLNKVIKKANGGPNSLTRLLCRMGLEPVNFVNGAVVYDGTDVELPGPLPFRWSRSWYSDSTYTGWLGHGVHNNYDRSVYLQPEDNCIGIRMADGRLVTTEWIAEGSDGYLREEKITIHHRETQIEIFDHDTFQTTIFAHFDAEANAYQLTQIRDAAGFSIDFTYRGSVLDFIIDSAGRQIMVDSDLSGRVTALYLKHNDQQDILIRYAYSAAGDMEAIVDALDQPTVIRYEGHLMVEKTDRNGQTFYWEYDGPNTGARCIHTWGDDGWQEGWISYFPEQGFNVLRDANGAETTYYYTPDQLVVAEKDALGFIKRFEYTEYMEYYREFDEEGNMTGYTYDDWGNQTSVVYPDGSEFKQIYDELSRLKLTMDGEGDSRVYTYRKENPYLINTIIEADNAITAFDYYANGLLHTVEKDGQCTKLYYDSDFNLSALEDASGNRTEWQYDYRGQANIVSAPETAVQRFEYDALGRVISVETADSNKMKLRYNAYDEVMEVRDHKKTVRFAYTPLGSLQMREEDGRRVYFEYDRMEQLKAVSNEHHEHYYFDRNLKGDIVREQTFDGVERYLARDGAGKVLRIQRPGGRWTAYEYDALGRIVRAEYYDGTWETYNYNRNGLLITAKNPEISIQLNRDSRGRVIQETQQTTLADGNAVSVESTYDKNGNRVQVTSSLGARVQSTYDKQGLLAQMQAQTDELLAKQQEAWSAQFSRNGLGQEIERVLTGGIRSRMAYDAAGRPLRQSVSNSSGRELVNKQYTWDANFQLKQVLDGLTQGVTSFSYDALGNLASARYEDGSFDYKLPDEVGNVYRDRYRKDRVYGSGGKLLKDQNWQYSYDVEGNLVLKTRRTLHGAAPQLANAGSMYRLSGERIDEKASYMVDDRAMGEQWQSGDWAYRWQGNGMLKEVIRPDGSQLAFEYDALGRRTAKIDVSKDRINRYLWDGNVLLQEWSYALQDRPKLVSNAFGELAMDRAEPISELITWVYEEGRFTPSAKLVGTDRYSIISDYLGTPIRAYDDSGTEVWSRELDIYGGVRKGSNDFVPFTYQGQYFDQETGLCYNRFRYYDPEVGNYVSQDPIGLAGNNPTAYGYVFDSNFWLDIFGLDSFAQRLGNFGEDWAKTQLENSGKYSSVFSVQNSSNQGIDLVGLRADGKFDIFEVKTNITGNSGKLSDRQANPQAFINDVLSNDKAGTGKYGISSALADRIRNNIGDKRVIDVFVNKGAKGKWYVNKGMISNWEDVAKLCK